MHRLLPLTIVVTILISSSALLAQPRRRGALLVPMQKDTLTLPPGIERKQQQWLKEQLPPRPGDEEVIAIIRNEEVAHGLVRSQAVVYQDSVATLSAQEPYDKASVVVLASKTQRLKALKQGIELPRETVLETNGRNQTLCAQLPECTALIETLSENYGMSVEEDWDLALYESSTLSTGAVSKAI